MFFGQLPTRDALGCIIAHSQRLPKGKIQKGTWLNERHIQQLENLGITLVTVARLDNNDIHEDEAALALAQALVGDGIRISTATTGRVNCYAQVTGLFNLPRERLLAINSISETITASTLAENTWVEAGKLVATIKIVPYAVSKTTLAAAIEASYKAYALHSTPIEKQLAHRLCVHAPRKRTAHFIQTTNQSILSRVLTKTEHVTTRRLATRQTELASSNSCEHTVNALSAQLKKILEQQSNTGVEPNAQKQLSNEWILIAGASAISDRGDVVPQALEMAGGRVIRCGIPVDPGNLLMLGQLGTYSVLGIPGCARSAKRNGLDLFLDRLSCDLPVNDHWISTLAIGGLMDEIVSRPQPRSASKSNVTSNQTKFAPQEITGILLAAGSSTRYASENKLLATLQGRPLIHHALTHLIDSNISSIIVVLGFEAAQVKRQCEKCLQQHSKRQQVQLSFVINPEFDSGMGSSLKAGVSQLLNNCANAPSSAPTPALVCLADMPLVQTATLNTLLDALQLSHSTTDAAGTKASAFVPTYNGTRGNPVLLMPELFDLILNISGDVGARHLLQANADVVQEVPVNSRSILTDVDTPDQLLECENNVNHDHSK